MGGGAKASGVKFWVFRATGLEHTPEQRTQP